MKKTLAFFVGILVLMLFSSSVVCAGSDLLFSQIVTPSVLMYDNMADPNLYCADWTPGDDGTIDTITTYAYNVDGTAKGGARLYSSSSGPDTILAYGVNTAVSSSGRFNVTLASSYEFSSGTTYYLCAVYNETNVDNTNDFEYRLQGSLGPSYYSTNGGSSWNGGHGYDGLFQAWGTNGSMPAASPPSPPLWVSPTPADGAVDNTQQIFNASCAAGLNYYMWFDNDNPPVTPVLVNSSSGNFTTSVTYFSGGNTSNVSYPYPREVASFPDADGLEDMAACYDPIMGETLLWTGHDSDLGDGGSNTWFTYDSSSDTWTNRTTGTRPDGVGVMFYDELNERCTLFIKHGADGIASISSAEWIYNRSSHTWTNVTDSTDPMPDRDTKEACYSPDTDMAYFFSGDDTGNNPTTTDLWGYNFSSSSWVDLTSSQSGTIPGKRLHMGFTYDRSVDKCLLFGGMDTGSSQLSSTYSLNPATLAWSQENWTFVNGSWSARSSMSTGFDEVRNLTIIANGRTGSITQAANSEQIWECDYSSRVCNMRNDTMLIGVIEAVNNPDFDDEERAILLVGGWITSSGPSYDNHSFFYPTTGVINGSNTYFYSAACYNASSGLFSTNTTPRNWTYDIQAPEIFLNSMNEFNMANRSVLNQFDEWLNLSMNFTDIVELNAWNITINASNATVMFTDGNSSLSGTNWMMMRDVNVSSWPAGWYDVRVWVNDGLNTKTIRKSWYRGTYAYGAETSLAGDPFEMWINVTEDSSFSLASSFLWNGTGQSVSEDNGSGWRYWNVTLMNQTAGNYWYFWTVNITQDDGNASQLFVNATNTVDAWFIDDCSIATAKVIRWRQYNENVPADLLNGTAQVLMEYWVYSANNTQIFNHTFPSANLFEICVSPADLTFNADIYLQNTVTGAFTHRFYVQNGSFSNVTTNYTLFNFVNQTGVSDMKITTRLEDDYSYLENVLVYLQRQYVGEGVWRTVQMDRSGDYGLLFFNILEENTDYRLIYYDAENNLLKQTVSMKFVCSGGVCDLTQLLGAYEETTTSDQVEATVTFDNATRVITVVWSGPPLESHTVELAAVKETVTGPLTLCSAIQVGASGTFTCNTTGVSGQVFVNAEVDGSSSAAAEWVDTRTSRLGDNMGRAEASLWSLGIAATIVMVGVFSPVGALIALVIGLLIIFFMGILTPLSVTAIILSSVVGIAISLKVKT